MTTEEREPKEISLKTAKREEFDDLRPIDWIEGVGTLGTWYEVNFIKRFVDVLYDIREDERNLILNELEQDCKKQIVWWDECGTRILHEGGISANEHTLRKIESLRCSHGGFR